MNWKDIGERTFWTFIEAGIGAIAAIKFDDPTLGVVVAAVAALVKSFAQQQLAKNK